MAVMYFLLALVSIVAVYAAIFTPIVLVSLAINWACWVYTRWRERRGR